MNRRRTWFLACLALVAALVGNWYLTRTDGRGDGPADRPLTTFDYALSDYDAVLFDADGAVTLRVSGPRLEHDPETRAARLIQPRFELPSDGADWRGRADHGLLDRDDETLTLLGNVEAVQPHAGGPVRIEAERLDHDRRAAVLRSDRPVRFSQAGTTLVGGTLIYFMDEDRVELEHDVHAIYRDASAGKDSGDATDPRTDRDLEPGRRPAGGG